MIQLNSLGRDAILEVGGVRSVTDVTGFGLAGHSYEMALGSGVTLVLELSALAAAAGRRAAGARKHLTRASATNAAYVAPNLQIEGKPDPVRLECFYDAQTSGGLLISVAADRADDLVASARQRRRLAGVHHRRGDRAARAPSLPCCSAPDESPCMCRQRRACRFARTLQRPRKRQARKRLPLHVSPSTASLSPNRFRSLATFGAIVHRQYLWSGLARK